MDVMTWSASERLFRSQHELFYDETLSAYAGEDRRMGRLRDFGWKCRNHAFHNSTKWGLDRWRKEGLFENVHIMIGSCTDCSAVIHASIEDAYLSCWRSEWRS